MEEFTYAHRDNSVPERRTYTEAMNRPRLPDGLQDVRQRAFAREIPVSSDETLCFLLTQLASTGARNVLEIGTATGVSGVAMLNVCKTAHLTTIEKNPAFYEEAKRTFEAFGVGDRVTQLLGDAGELLPKLEGQFDFIFLDSAKVQYIKYLPHLKRLLRTGGTLFADDVLLYGYVTGEVPTPPKRRALVAHVKEYLDAVCADEQLLTTVLNVGDGVALSVKRA